MTMIEKIIQTTKLIGILAAAVVFLSCSEDRTSTGYRVHPTGWEDSHSEEFHGQGALAGQGQSCGSCHGEDFTGKDGVAGCYDCHVYPHPTVTDGSAEAHQQLIASLDWDLGECSGCHGSDYSGGRTGASCLSCHPGPNGPEDCTTCHWLPPVNDDGLPYGMLTGAAGAHSVHVSKGYACTECHPQVNGISHADALPAEVTFADAEIANVDPYQPVYFSSGDPLNGNGSCGSVYCHSDAQGGDPNRAVYWHGEPLACGDCHSVPPTSPLHPEDNTCHHCHLHVDPNSNYSVPDSIRFLDDDLHVNGVINVVFH